MSVALILAFRVIRVVRKKEAGGSYSQLQSK